MTTYNQRALNSHLSMEIAKSCTMLSIHARGIVLDANKITERPPFDPYCREPLENAERVLKDALHYVRAAKERIVNLPVEMQAAE